MPDHLHIIWILALGLSLAGLFGYLAQRLKLSPILGYLLAGFLIGPNSPGFIADQYMTDQLANIGLTLLMFAVGLSFNWKDINAVKKVVVPGAISLCFLSISMGILLTISLGSTFIEGFVIGIAICVSSTVVIARVLSDQHLLHTKQGHIVIGWTILEDLVSILGLVILPSLIFPPRFFAEVHPGLSLFYSIVLVFFKIAALGLVVYFVGEKFIEKILKVIARTKSHELFTLATLALLFLVAAGSSYFFGVSVALGAFIAGTVVGKTELSHQAAANALPMRDAFAVVFFLSVGMLFDPFVLKNNLPLFLGILLIILIIRPLAGFLIMKLAQYPNFVSLTVAIAISQIGEYSFIIAEEGSRLKILPDDAYDILVACAFISIALNPILFQFFKRFTHPEKEKQGNYLHEFTKKPYERGHLAKAILIGFDEMGRTICSYLKHHYETLVIDQNIDTVTTFKEKGLEILYGDAKQTQLLEQAKLQEAKLVVITASEFQETKSIIQAIRQINSSVEIVARVANKSNQDPIDFKNIILISDEEESYKKMISTLKALNL